MRKDLDAIDGFICLYGSTIYLKDKSDLIPFSQNFERYFQLSQAVEGQLETVALKSTAFSAESAVLNVGDMRTWPYQRYGRCATAVIDVWPAPRAKRHDI